MRDCAKYKGRLRDLCEGVGRNGRPNPSQRAIDAFAAKEKFMPATAVDQPAVVKVPDVSSIGTNLAKIFKDEIAAIPCGECKQRIAKLNQMTASEVQADRANIVKTIASSAARNAPSWWQKILVIADQSLGTGFTEDFIGKCLDRACGVESANPFPVTARVIQDRTFAYHDSDWCVAITTAPRKGEDTLSECLDSLRVAGWESPIVFAEPGSIVPADVTTIWNETRRGCFHNWLHSARWALENTTAKMILCVQDDAVFHPDSREFAEKHCLWPADNAGFVSLYTPSHYTHGKHGTREPGVNCVKTTCLWGTLAVIWKRDVLQAVVDDPKTNEWLGIAPKKTEAEKSDPEARRARVDAYYAQRRANPHLINNSDYLAGYVVNKLRKKMYFVDPSPVYHSSKVSTIGHGGNRGQRNCGRCADHGVPLEQQVFAESEKPIEINLIKPRKMMDKNKRVIPSGDVRIISPANDKHPRPQLTILIRSCFADPEMSAHRWKITKTTLLKSLESQTDKRFTVELICDSGDHFCDEKLEQFNRIAPTKLADANWYNEPHDGIWRRVARIDDDDIVSVKFVESINNTAFDETECLLNFPNGSIFVNGELHKWTFPASQFVIIQTNTRLNPYSTHHRYFQWMLPTVIVSRDIHWAWVRHLAALSTDVLSVPVKRYSQGVIQVDADLFPYDFTAIDSAIAKTDGTHSKMKEARATHGRSDVAVAKLCLGKTPDDLSVLADRYGTDKGITGSETNHRYTIVYDRLFSGIRDQVSHVLEFGVYEGASLKMWADYFPNAIVHGLDKRKANVDHPRVVVRKHNAVNPLNTEFRYDLIIDDASHISSHSRRMFDLHSRLVKPGGFYVIEDLMLHRYGRRFTDESPNMLETCREWVFSPPEGWTCNLYGDQLCILKRDE